MTFLDAVSSGKVNMAKIAIESGADVNAVTTDTSGLKTMLMVAVEHERYAMSEFLLQHGADVNESTDNRYESASLTALERHLFKQFNKNTDKFVQLLVGHGADINKIIEGPDNWTLLTYCIAHGDAQTAEALLNAGAALHVEHSHCSDVLFYAKECEDPQMVALIERTMLDRSIAASITNDSEHDIICIQSIRTRL